jgi:hypothetical protein
MKQDKNLDKILNLARVNNMPLPDAIKERPVLMIGLEVYWKAFWELSTCRAIGMMEGPIPWLAIRDYAFDFNLEGLSKVRFYAIIRGMDNAYLRLRSKEIEKKNPKNG